MTSVRFGVLGCASIARKYAIDSIRKCGKLVAVASRDFNKAKAWAQEFDCEAESYDSLLSRKDIDAIYISLPTGLHSEWTIKAAEKGKHVLCEKALSTSYGEVKRMIGACKKNKVLLFENHMVEYHPQHKEVISAIESGEIGDIRLFVSFYCFPPFKEDNIRYRRELGGGAINDAAGYIVFMSRKLFCEEPESVSCTTFKGDYYVDIEGNLDLQFKNGKRAMGFFGFNNFYQNNYSIYGTSGKVYVGRSYSIPGDLKPEVVLYKQDSLRNIEVPSANQFDLIFQDFVKKIHSGERDYEKLMLQAKVMECLRISASENKRIFLSEIN